MLKQRLVGAAVIIALGVVIIPMLLDGSGNRIIQEIPPRPERQGVSGTGTVENQTIPSLPKRDESTIASMKEGSERVGDDMEPMVKEQPSTVTKSELSAKSEPSAKKSVIKTPVKKKISESPVTKTQAGQSIASWVVQIGSFSEKAKAVKLRDQFRAKGFSVFVEQFRNAENQSMYRVRVGTVQNRSQAETLLNQLKQKTKLQNGYVTQHP